MTRSRKELVSVSDTPYYHVTSRCVRQAFLCGFDSLSGRNFEHRKQWVIQRLDLLTSVFAIDLVGYAVMSNHYHLVVKLEPGLAEAWSDETVVKRWQRVFGLPLLASRWLAGAALGAAEQAAVDTEIARMRTRLADLSWFMRCLNEHLARRANAEDRCKGRFWEGRFQSQALLDEIAVLTALAYVDLNPIRADIAKTPETSDYTSIQQRIRQQPRPALTAFCGEPAGSATDTDPDLPFTFPDYLELVDWTGRAIRISKIGFIPETAPPILERLGITQDAWIDAMRYFPVRFRRAIGPVEKIQKLCARLELRWLWHGRSALYPRPRAT